MASTNFNSYPQPKTFAPSREDVLTNLQYFFGASPQCIACIPACPTLTSHHAWSQERPSALRS